MDQLIDLSRLPANVVRILQFDQTTKENLVFASSSYASFDESDSLPDAKSDGSLSFDLQPRIAKTLKSQAERTKKNAEVFTPAWVCNMMINHIDADWFGYEDAFNRQVGNDWEPNPEKIIFPKGKTWKSYVKSRRLEITCGEAPFLVSRYDSASGEIIPIEKRIGVLDRKLRVVGENTSTEQDWFEWALTAIQYVYGYEFQGDNLLVARINVLCTFSDYLEHRWNRKPTNEELELVANTISWNLWQMDGLSGYVPLVLTPSCDIKKTPLLVSESGKAPTLALIEKWNKKQAPFVFQYLKQIRKGSTKMFFDYVIGNPPYQDETSGDNATYAPPVYHHFMEAAFAVANKVELIHPARFLFNAGSTPEQWNQKMLNDEHFKIVYYEQDSSKIFVNKDIKGGVVISYRDTEKDFGKIEIFTVFQELKSIMEKVRGHKDFISLSNIVVSRVAYRLTDKMHEDFPEAITRLSKGHRYDMSTNIFERLPFIFFDAKPDTDHQYIQILGRENNQRVYKYVRRDYVNDVANLDKYKIILPKSNGSGAIGEVLSTPLIGTPLIGNTESFISIGSFETLLEAENVFKYIKGKFSRTLLGVLKVTQDNPPDKWQYVPLQDFTANSDIDWSQSIRDIDQQLYRKYGLTQAEIEFIESKVKEME